VAHLAESIAAVIIAGLAAFVALEYLKAYKRRNDLLDRFQAYERANEVRLLRADQTADRFDNLLAAHERLAARVGELDAYAKKEIAALGTTVLDEVKSIKTTQAASFEQQQARRAFRP
jgi:hypothetical protein